VTLVCVCSPAAKVMPGFAPGLVAGLFIAAEWLFLFEVGSGGLFEVALGAARLPR
jgi:hypothetical protein